jgi:hypothetical protein
MNAKISPKVEINPNGYLGQNFIEGTAEEKAFCAFIGLTANRDIYLSPKQFLMIYIELVKMVYAGLEIDLNLYPCLRETKIIEDIHTLRGKQLGSLFKAFVFENIVFFLTGEDEKFLQEARNEFLLFEAKLVLSQFFP